MTQQIPSAQSSYAPGLAEINGNLVAVWSDATNEALKLAVFDTATLNWSGVQEITSAFSEVRPAVAIWNDVYYVVYRGASADSAMYWWFSDLATLPMINNINTAFNATLSCDGTPYTFSYMLFTPAQTVESYLITTMNSSDSVNTINYFGFQADWLTANVPNMLVGQSSIALTIPAATAGCLAVLPGFAPSTYVWCLVYGDGSQNIQALSCYAEDWQSGVQSQIPTSNPSAPATASPSITATGGVFCVAWPTANGCFYSIGTTEESGPIITWTGPFPIMGLPSGVTDITLTTGTSTGQIYVGYCVPTSNIGILPLPGIVASDSRPRRAARGIR